MRHITLFGDDAKQNSPLNQIIESAQDRQLDIIEETIDDTMIDERELKIEYVGSVYSLVTKINGTILRTTLS